jgi:hypothetical protein
MHHPTFPRCHTCTADCDFPATDGDANADQHTHTTNGDIHPDRHADIADCHTHTTDGHAYASHRHRMCCRL